MSGTEKPRRQDSVEDASSDRWWRTLWRLLRHYAWRYRWSYLAGGVFLAVTNWIAVTIPGEIGKAIDALDGGGEMSRYVLLIGGLGLAMIGVRTLSRVLIFNPARDLEYQLRRDLFAKLLRLQPAFYASHRRGDIVSRAANDISWVRTLVGYGGLQVVNVTMAVVLTGWKMVALSGRLTLLVLLPVGLSMAVVQWGIRRLFALSRRNQEELGEISEHVLGSLQGMPAIQGFVAEEAFIRRFEQRNQRWLRTGMRLAIVRAAAMPLLVLGGGLAMVALIGVGGSLVLDGHMSVGNLVAFSALLTVLLPSLRSMGFMLSVIQRGRAALERIFELVDAPEERPEGPEGVFLEAGRGPAIDIRDLSYAYPDDPDRPVLRDLTVSIPAGSRVGLFGRTGSGKTTLLRLLARLYNPPAGTILVDGTDIRDLDLDAWRRRLAVVPQRPFLFSDTVASNVALDAEPDPARIDRAVGRAALEGDLESLPDGLGTVVGERGIMLSGGQRQRVALARGLYRGGDLLILDDVLSAVDHHTELELVDTIASLAKRPGAPTVLIASHRMSALRHTDRVLVLDQGRLVDVGTHAELVERPGVYRDTWRAQRTGTGQVEEVAAS
jgi:ATP-binding cassette subfamily B protein